VNQNRRTFLSSSGQALGAGWLTLNWPAITAAAVQAVGAAGTAKILNVEQVRDLDAISAQIIPTDDTPGAREAGTVFFIDSALGSFYSPHRAEFLADYEEFAASIAAQTQGKRFADVPAARQTELLKLAESTRFFGSVRMLTVVGYLVSPQYGGNRNGIGWQAIGFKDEHVFEPPFGYYDREYTGFVPYDMKAKP
jgi:hypothetical protein